MQTFLPMGAKALIPDDFLTRGRMRNARREAALVNMQTTIPALQVRHSESDAGQSWTVRAIFENGEFEEVAGFQSETEANDWIAHKFPIWLQEIRKARTG